MPRNKQPQSARDRKTEPAARARRAAPEQPERRPVPIDETGKVYGLAAALAVMERRPEQVVRIAHNQAARRALAPALREAARRRIAYREVSDEELARIAGSVHHEGVCLLAAERKLVNLDELARRAAPHGLLVALDRVANPHNVGAIVRSAAFFDASGLVLTEHGNKREGLPPAAVRVAEGGAEHLDVARISDLPAALRELAEIGFGIVGADAHGEHGLSQLRWPARSVLVLGSEDLGLAPAVRAACDFTVRIEGGGAVESLNVSVAAGVLLASFAAAAGGARR